MLSSHLFDLFLPGVLLETLLHDHSVGDHCWVAKRRISDSWCSFLRSLVQGDAANIHAVKQPFWNREQHARRSLEVLVDH